MSLWIWTQMRHLGTLIPRFCTEFRYLSYGQSGLAWGAIFEKVPKYQETPSFSKICMSIFPGTGSQNEFFPYVPPAAFSNGELEGRSPSRVQGRVWEARGTIGPITTSRDLLQPLGAYCNSTFIKTGSYCNQKHDVVAVGPVWLQ